MSCRKQHFHLNYFNPLRPGDAFLYPLKTLESVFRGYRKAILSCNGFIENKFWPASFEVTIIDDILKTVMKTVTQPSFTCSESTMETPEECMKSVQS